jgi:hypothetical protein
VLFFLRLDADIIKQLLKKYREDKTMISVIGEIEGRME